MRCAAQVIDDVVVLSLQGKITVGWGEEEVRSKVSHYLEKGMKRFVLDLAGVTSLDSSGMGEIVSAYTRVTSRGGLLALSRLPEKVQDILTINQLITVFDAYDDIESAVKAIKSKPFPDLS